MDFEKIFSFIKNINIGAGEFFFILLIGYSIHCWLTLNDIKLTGFKHVRLNDLSLRKISDAIDNMNPFEFEDFVAYLFKKLGDKVEQTSKSRDGGYDIKLNNGESLVEIKHYSDGNNISRPIVQKLVGACIENDVDNGIIVTTSNFTKEAYESIKKCKKVNIDVLYKDDLLRMCKQIDSSEVLVWLGYNREEVCQRYEY